MFPTISIFATIAFLFCDGIFGEVSGKIPASSDFFFYFMGEPVFATCSCCRERLFCCGGVLLLQINLTVNDIDPTARDLGAV
jgi:hypothetical protein